MFIKSGTYVFSVRGELAYPFALLKMWLFNKKQAKTLESQEFAILSAKLNRLSCALDTLETEFTSILKQLKILRSFTNSRFKIPEEKEEKEKDINRGIFLSDNGSPI